MEISEAAEFSLPKVPSTHNPGDCSDHMGNCDSPSCFSRVALLNSHRTQQEVSSQMVLALGLHYSGH